MLLLNLLGCSTLNVFTDWLTLHHHKYFQITNFNRLWPNTCLSISITIANRHVNTSWSWLPVRSEHPLLPRQYVINAPETISAGYIKRIAEVVKKAIKDSLHDEISNTIVEKLIIKNPPQQLQIENTNYVENKTSYSSMDDTHLQCYLVSLNPFPRYQEDTKAKILEGGAVI